MLQNYDSFVLLVL